MNQPRPIRITALEDDASFTETLKLVLESEGEFVLTGAYRNPIHFLGELPQLETEVFLLDVNLPKLSGVDCVNEVRREHPGSRILILTVHDSDELVLKAFLHGADGYILKDDPLDDILEAIREALRGGAPMSRAVAKKVVGLLGKGRVNDEEASTTPGANKVVEALLSPRELEILHLLADGHRYADIAERLCVSKDTVKTHVRHIYEKLHVRNKAEAVSRLLR
jgi:DNA-binding NarL/FixJ family response regulator